MRIELFLVVSLCLIVLFYIFRSRIKQFRNWSLPSKVTYVSFVISMLGLPLILDSYFVKLFSEAKLSKFQTSQQTLLDEYKWEEYKFPLDLNRKKTISVGECPSDACTKIHIVPTVDDNGLTQLDLKFDAKKLVKIADDGMSADFAIIKTGTGHLKDVMGFEAGTGFTYNIGVITVPLVFNKDEAVLMCMPTEDVMAYISSDSINNPKISVYVKKSSFSGDPQCEFINQFDQYFYNEPKETIS